MKPVKVKRTSTMELSVLWDDGHTGYHTMSTLRTYCPCASCKANEESRESSALLPILVPGQYDLRGIEPVGNYAFQFVWGDGHNTGIYTFEYLRSLCECERCRKPDPR